MNIDTIGTEPLVGLWYACGSYCTNGYLGRGGDEVLRAILEIYKQTHNRPTLIRMSFDVYAAHVTHCYRIGIVQPLGEQSVFTIPVKDDPALEFGTLEIDTDDASPAVRMTGWTL